MALTKAHSRMIEGSKVNVLDYGATGDGVTDDSTAVQAAWAAVVAQGGGTLYFPAGTYLCNVSGVGSDRVSIEGEGYGSVICSYAANDFAVKYDGGFASSFSRSIRKIRFADSTGAQTKHGLYVNNAGGIHLEDVTFEGLGIGVCNNASWGWYFENVVFNCYCGVFSTCATGANTSITNVNGQTVTITDAFFPQHPGIQLFENCRFSGKIGMYFEQPDNPFSSEAGLKFIRCLMNPSSGVGVYLADTGWTQPVSFDSVWMEGSLAPVAIRSLTLPAKYIYTVGEQTEIKNTFVSQIEIGPKSVCHFENVSMASPAGLTKSGISAYTFDGVSNSTLGGLYLPYIVKNTVQLQVDRGISFHTPAKVNLCRAYSGSLIESHTCFSGDSFDGNFGSTITDSTADSVFNTLESKQVISNNTLGFYPFAAYTASADKVYVTTVALQSLGSAFDLLLRGIGAGNATVTVPAGRWQTYACVGITTAGSKRPLVQNNSGSTQTYLVSGFQQLEFDNYTQAEEFLASSAFNI